MLKNEKSRWKLFVFTYCTFRQSSQFETGLSTIIYTNINLP